MMLTHWLESKLISSSFVKAETDWTCIRNKLAVTQPHCPLLFLSLLLLLREDLQRIVKREHESYLTQKDGICEWTSCTWDLKLSFIWNIYETFSGFWKLFGINPENPSIWLWGLLYPYFFLWTQPPSPLQLILKTLSGCLSWLHTPLCRVPSAAHEIRRAGHYPLLLLLMMLVVGV